MTKTLTIDAQLIVQAPTTEGHKNHGRDCILAHSPELEAVLEEHYARRGLCLKVFKNSTGKDARGYQWGGASLFDCTRVQNIFAMYGIAPRVYDIVAVNGRRLAQVCDYATGEGEPDIKLAQELVRKYKIGAAGYENRRQKALDYVALDFKWVGGLFVDFGRFHITNKPWYKERLRKKIQHRRRGEARACVGYQELPALGIPGQRRLRHRMRHMRLDDYDFTGKTVLDLGANLGCFCREAINRGAKRVVGVDCYRTQLWQEANNWLGYWNIDYLNLELPKLWTHIPVITGIERFDAVFALAIVQHMEGGYGEWIAKLTKEVLWMEGTWNAPESKYRPALERDFRRVELLGYIRDEQTEKKPDKRPLFRCWHTAKRKAPRLPMLPKERREAAILRAKRAGGRVMLHDDTLGFLYDMAERAPKGRAIEVGAMDGASTCCWMAAREGRGPAEVIEIEDITALVANLEHYGYACRVIIGDSAKHAPETDDIAFLFIDGDHSYEGVRADIAAYMPHVKSGGIVVFHDCLEGKHRGVRMAVTYWRQVAKWPTIGSCRSAIAFRRPVDGEILPRE